MPIQALMVVVRQMPIRQLPAFEKLSAISTEDETNHVLDLLDHNPEELGILPAGLSEVAVGPRGYQDTPFTEPLGAVEIQRTNMQSQCANFVISLIGQKR